MDDTTTGRDVNPGESNRINEMAREGVYQKEAPPHGNTIDSGRTTGTQVQDRADEAAGQAGQAMNQVKDTAKETADKAMNVGADRMEGTADTIREKVDGQGGIREKAGMAVADKMEDSAKYLRDHDAEEVMADVERYVKEHPLQAVVGAVAIGFLAGRILR
jgi:ElaB/YqjD/DUF883 family membrane-anchored ribosome-binding protein